MFRSSANYVSKLSGSPKELWLSLDESKIEHFFLTRGIDRKKSKIPIHESLKLETCINLTSYAIKVLTSLGKNTINLGNIDLTYCLPIEPDQSVRELSPTINRDSEIQVLLDRYQHGNLLNNSSIDSLINNDTIQYGIFSIYLAISDKTGRGTIGHKAAGFVNKKSKKIFIYDGASWINFVEGIKVLNQHLTTIFQDYEVIILAKSHQTLYGTCSMFQPAVVYLMILLNNPYIIIAYLDRLNDQDRETLIDNAVIDLFDYVEKPLKSQFIFEDKPEEQTSQNQMAL